MNLTFQRPDGSVFVVPAPDPTDREGWMLLPLEPDDMPVLPHPSAAGDEAKFVTIALLDLACCTCLRLWHQRRDANAVVMADAVAERERLTRERDAWKLRTQRAEESVNGGCRKEGGAK